MITEAPSIPSAAFVQKPAATAAYRAGGGLSSSGRELAVQLTADRFADSPFPLPM
ncbi:hypothetical protein K523DRAFT_320193 [Schizophyllum commune Tattone D]|nr:hypothetical protein K523DRAFT_320193 [Schizophyllum commune Tattone D]